MTLPSRSALECISKAPLPSKSPMVDTPIADLHRTPISREQQDAPRTEHPPEIHDPVSFSRNLDCSAQMVDHGSRVGMQRRTRPPPLDLSMFNAFGNTALHPQAPIQPLPNPYHALDDQQWILGRNHVGFMGMDTTSLYHNEVAHRQNYPSHLPDGRARAFSEAMHMPLPVSMEIPLPPSFSNEGVPRDIVSASS